MSDYLPELDIRYYRLHLHNKSLSKSKKYRMDIHKLHTIRVYYSGATSSYFITCNKYKCSFLYSMTILPLAYNTTEENSQ